MVSRLRSPNSDLSVELFEDRHQLGMPITGRVTLMPGESFQMRDGKVEFFCTETYYVRVRRTTRMGSAETNEPAATVVRQYSQTIFEGSDIANLMPQVGNINLTIPTNAPPTVKGVVANLVWTMKVTLDVARARDITREIDLVVLPVPGESADNAQQNPEANTAVSHLAECDMNLSMGALLVRMGESFEGVFRIFPKSGFTPETARVELMRMQKAGTSQIDESVVLLEFDAPEASTGVDGTDAVEFPFSLPVPECLLATITVHETSVLWRVRGSVRFDSRKELEITQMVTVRGSS